MCSGRKVSKGVFLSKLIRGIGKSVASRRWIRPKPCGAALGHPTAAKSLFHRRTGGRAKEDCCRLASVPNASVNLPPIGCRREWFFLREIADFAQDCFLADCSLSAYCRKAVLSFPFGGVPVSHIGSRIGSFVILPRCDEVAKTVSRSICRTS